MFDSRSAGLVRMLKLWFGVLLAGVPVAGSAVANDMHFTLQEEDLRPRGFDLYQWIFADGDIVPGTSDQFKAFVASHLQLIGGATVILNSPGGSATEGMRLGETIRDLHFRTAVGVKSTEPLKSLPGQCMSACIYPYLGGDYRYLDDGSVIGIHRFKFGQDLGGQLTAEVSQQLSGEIVDYIKKSSRLLKNASILG